MKITAAAALLIAMFIPAAVHRSPKTEWLPIFEESENGKKFVHSVAINAVTRRKDGIVVAATKIEHFDLVHREVAVMYTVNKLDCETGRIRIVADAGVNDSGDTVFRNTIANTTESEFVPAEDTGMNALISVVCFSKANTV